MAWNNKNSYWFQVQFFFLTIFDASFCLSKQKDYWTYILKQKIFRTFRCKLGVFNDLNKVLKSYYFMLTYGLQNFFRKKRPSKIKINFEV